jgi:hypothetical protein
VHHAPPVHHTNVVIDLDPFGGFHHQPMHETVIIGGDPFGGYGGGYGGGDHTTIIIEDDFGGDFF